MKLATKGVRGEQTRSAGVPICSMRPRLRTTTLSASSKASFWSCVTMTVVMPMPLRSSLVCSLSCPRTTASSAPNGSSSCARGGGNHLAASRSDGVAREGGVDREMPTQGTQLVGDDTSRAVVSPGAAAAEVPGLSREQHAAAVLPTAARGSDPSGVAAAPAQAARGPSHPSRSPARSPARVAGSIWL